MSQQALKPLTSKTEESPCYRHPMTDHRWNQLLYELKTTLLGSNWLYAKRLASAIAEKIRWLDPIMNRYCFLTCHECEDRCCHATEIYFNRADMLYLTLLDSEIPQGQTRCIQSAPCRYLTPDGCMLSRTVRPYVCVWFICEAQMDIFQAESAAFQRRFLAETGKLREHRLALEGLYENAARQIEEFALEAPHHSIP